VAGPPKLRELLATLAGYRVDLIVVGGVAAVLEGAGMMTDDLDVLVETSEPNVERLLAALDDLEAVYRDPAGRTLRPDAKRLGSFRLHLLDTRLGRLDLLRSLGPGKRTYADLVPRSRLYRIGELEIPVLELSAVIEAKEAADRPKDRAALPLLRRTLEELRSRRRHQGKPPET
jgi:hypothetical protein